MNGLICCCHCLHTVLHSNNSLNESHLKISGKRSAPHNKQGLFGFCFLLFSHAEGVTARLLLVLFIFASVFWNCTKGAVRDLVMPKANRCDLALFQFVFAFVACLLQNKVFLSFLSLHLLSPLPQGIQKKCAHCPAPL